MDFIADLHIHSPFSRATSPASTLYGLAGWARVKGINVVGTGDFTHPEWFKTLRAQLEPAEPGLYRLLDEQQVVSPLERVPLAGGPVRFLLSAEISCIYKRHGRVRKVHNLVYMPDFESAERLNTRLAGIGNIRSDGRPILGLDSRDLLEMVLETTPHGILVPAHVWTPWFSLFGAKSGFDSLEECFGDLSSHVFALETGLSSDPAMNRLISGLDKMALISNSDCHSPSKLGRESNVFSTGFDYFSMWGAVKNNSSKTFRGTVEFFAEEGKYHADGHRACDVCLDAVESRSRNGICPVCGKLLTIGVHHRVLELSDRTEPLFAPDAPGVFSLIPLQELLAELLDAGPATKKVMAAYARLITRFTSELELLISTPITDINCESPLLAEAINRMRRGSVIRTPGYDGVYGTIKVFSGDDRPHHNLSGGILSAERAGR